MSTRSLWASVTPMLVAWLFLTTAPAAVHAQPREEATADNVFTGTLDVRMGQRVFRQQCGRCHGRDGAGGELGPDLTEGFRSASTDAGLFKIVREGIPNTQMIGISRSSTARPPAAALRAVAPAAARQLHRRRHVLQHQVEREARVEVAAEDEARELLLRGGAAPRRRRPHRGPVRDGGRASAPDLDRAQVPPLICGFD